MNYWSNSNATVHVFDGSSDKLEDFSVLNFPSNIHYHHYPVSFAERITIAASFIKTEYSVLLGDDDMFLKSGLKSCIDELEQNNQIISCLGRTMSFYHDNGHLLGDIVYQEMENYQVSDEDPFQRMSFHMNPYCCSILYSVIRSEQWKKAASLISLSAFPDPGVVELQFELAICFLGKSKVIPSLMWMRSYENPSLYDGKQVPFYTWWNDSNYGNLKNELLENFSNVFNDSKLYNNEYIKLKVHEALSKYVDWAIVYTKQSFSFKNLLFIILQKIKALKLIFSKDNFKSSTLKLSQNGINVNHIEVDEFILFILKFYS
jgi:glycosyltransferase domain-containing protein